MENDEENKKTKVHRIMSRELKDIVSQRPALERQVYGKNVPTDIKYIKENVSFVYKSHSFAVDLLEEGADAEMGSLDILHNYLVLPLVDSPDYILSWIEATAICFPQNFYEQFEGSEKINVSGCFSNIFVLGTPFNYTALKKIRSQLLQMEDNLLFLHRAEEVYAGRQVEFGPFFGIYVFNPLARWTTDYCGTARYIDIREYDFDKKIPDIHFLDLEDFLQNSKWLEKARRLGKSENLEQKKSVVSSEPPISASGGSGERFRVLEGLIRNFILTGLKKHFGENDDEWWTRGVPEKIRNSCQQRQETTPDHLAPHLYFQFHEYGQVILKNWELFQKIFPQEVHFKSKSKFKKWFEVLNDARNAVSHSRRSCTDQENQVIQEAFALFKPHHT